MKTVIAVFVLLLALGLVTGCEEDLVGSPFEFVNRSSFTVTVRPTNQPIAAFSLAPGAERSFRRSDVSGNEFTYEYTPGDRVRAEISGARTTFRNR